MVVGRVAVINLYPVKSMRGVPVPRAELYWYGFNGDRKYAFVRAGVTSGFPWLTGRELPNLLKHEPQFIDAEDHHGSDIAVTMPNGESFELRSSRLQEALSEAVGSSVSLLHLNRGTFDCMPVSLVTTSMLATLGKRMGQPFDPRRLRANLIVETDGADLEPERAWLGKSLVIGDKGAALHVAYPTRRCVMVNLEPESGESSPQMLKTLAASFETQAGVYASVAQLGEVTVGDVVRLEPEGRGPTL